METEKTYCLRAGAMFKYKEQFITNANLTNEAAEWYLMQNDKNCNLFSSLARPFRNPRAKIFIVHGHDNNMKSNVARFVYDLGFEPIILHEQANQGRTIIEKIEKHSDDVSYVIVLLSPDDIGNAKTNRGELNPRARQNVVFELGLFIGKLGRNKVCALVKGSVEKPSDINGIVYIPYSGSWRQNIIKELKAAIIDS